MLASPASGLAAATSSPIADATSVTSTVAWSAVTVTVPAWTVMTVSPSVTNATVSDAGGSCADAMLMTSAKPV